MWLTERVFPSPKLCSKVCSEGCKNLRPPILLGLRDFKKLSIPITCFVNIQTDKINRKLVRVDYMKAHSKSGKRIIDLSDYAVKVLNELKALTGDRFYVLNSAGNNPISENNFNSNLKKYCKKCGIPYYSSHKIRFYQCSRMYELQIDEKDIQAEMGHSTLEMTRHYDRRRSKRFTDEKANLVFGR